MAVVSCVAGGQWSCFGQEMMGESGSVAGGEFVVEAIQRIEAADSNGAADFNDEVVVVDSPQALVDSWDERIESLLSWGPVDIRPHIDYDVAYHDNIFASVEQDAIEDVIHEFSPGFAVESVASRIGGLGSEPLYFELDYTPTVRLFQDTTSQNNVDQAARIVVQQPFQRVGLRGQFDFLDTQNPFAEAGNRTQKTITSGGLGVSYELGGKTSLDLGLRAEIRDFDFLIDTRQWSNMNWVDYDYSEKVNVGVGVGAGYTEVEDHSDFIMEDLRVRAKWTPTEKLVASLSGGAQWRQFRDDVGDGSKVSPIIAGDLAWYVLRNTMVRLLVSQQVYASNFVGGNTEDNTRFSGQLRQRVLQKVDFTLSGGLGHIESNSFDPTIQSVRARGYHFFDAQVAYQFLDRGRFSLYYQLREREGNSSVNESVQNRVGMRLGYSF